MGRNFFMVVASAAFGISVTRPPIHSSGSGCEPLMKALTAARRQPCSSLGPYWKYSYGIPSRPGALPLGSLRIRSLSESMSIGRLRNAPMSGGNLRMDAQISSGI